MDIMSGDVANALPCEMIKPTVVPSTRLTVKSIPRESGGVHECSKYLNSSKPTIAIVQFKTLGPGLSLIGAINKAICALNLRNRTIASVLRICLSYPDRCREKYGTCPFRDQNDCSTLGIAMAVDGTDALVVRRVGAREVRSEFPEFKDLEIEGIATVITFDLGGSENLANFWTRVKRYLVGAYEDDARSIGMTVKDGFCTIVLRIEEIRQ